MSFAFFFIKGPTNVPRTPQQNDLVEHMNMSKWCSCIRELGYARVFGGEDVRMAVYLINKCPSTILEFKTPTKVWSGETLNVYWALMHTYIKQDKL